MTITTADVRHGIKAGVIRFITSPNDGIGTVCAIGDYWFYFGGYTAEEIEPEDYLDTVGIFDTAREIKDALEGIKLVYLDEYNYYCACINEALQSPAALQVT